MFVTKSSSGSGGVCEAFLPPPLGVFGVRSCGLGARGARPDLRRGVSGVLPAVVTRTAKPRFVACPTPSRGQKTNAQEAVSTTGTGARIAALPSWATPVYAESFLLSVVSLGGCHA